MAALMAAGRREELLGILGEGIHTSLRKAGSSEQADDAWHAINEMPPDDWRSVLTFLVDGLESMGVRISRTPPTHDAPKSARTQGFAE